MQTSSAGCSHHHYWALAQNLFQDHMIYGSFFQDALKSAPKQRLWVNRVKNRLAKMVKTVREHMDEMGKTGQGLTSAEEIDMSQDNALTNAWVRIKLTCPWFWVLKGLISQRPNAVPVGLGNNTSGYEVDILSGPSTSEPIQTLENDVHSVTSENDGLGDGMGGLEDGDPDLSAAESEPWTNLQAAFAEEDEGITPLKRKMSSCKPNLSSKRGRSGPHVESETPSQNKSKTAPTVSIVPKRQPRTGKSEPASASRAKKGNNMVEKFAEAAAKQDETAHRLLDLKREKSNAQLEAEKAKTRGQIEVKMQRDRLRAEYALRKLELEERRQEREHQLAMAHLQPHAGPSVFHHQFPSFDSAKQWGSGVDGLPASGSSTSQSATALTENTELFNNFQFDL